MERLKMPRSERAKQFMPFDALKGLQDALRLKEYKHEKTQMGELSEETIEEISNTLSSLKRGDIVEAVVFVDGYKKTFSGGVKFKLETEEIIVEETKINLNNILSIKKI